MNQLFIIGNGFDLAHGLETSYRSFITWYLNKVFHEIISNSYFEDPLIKYDGRRKPLNVDFYYLYNSPTSAELFQIQKPDEFLKKLQELNIEPKLDYFFQQIIDSSLWVDIEMLYYQSLIRCMRNLIPMYHIDNLHIAFDHIKKLLEQYILKVILPEIRLKQAMPSVEEIFKGNQSVVDEGTWLILNFNYTNTIRIYDGLFPNTIEIRCLNIHGDLSNQNPMIFGYGDEIEDDYLAIEKLNNNEYLKNMKSFGYFHTENYKELIRFIKFGGKFQVHVLGHSLGLSDRLLLNTVFECEACESIEIHYHHTSAQSDDFNHLVRNLSRHFNKDFKSKMRESVIPFQKSRPIDQKPS